MLATGWPKPLPCRVPRLVVHKTRIGEDFCFRKTASGEDDEDDALKISFLMLIHIMEPVCDDTKNLNENESETFF